MTAEPDAVFMTKARERVQNMTDIAVPGANTARGQQEADITSRTESTMKVKAMLLKNTMTKMGSMIMADTTMKASGITVEGITKPDWGGE